MRLALLLALLPLPALAEIEVRDPVAVRAYEAAPTGAVYLALTNPGGPDDRLLAATADLAPRAEIHATETAADGTMVMIPQTDGLPLAADGEIRLQPGGLHVMLLGLTPGDAVTLTLTFEAAGEIAVTAPFVPRDEALRLHGAAMEGMDHGH